MSTPLRVLMVEDSPDDVLLLVRELRRGGFEPVYERVETAEDLQRALKSGTWDLVISDYNMPHFQAMEALRLLREQGLDAPFVVVSGSVGEEIAVETMKAGANDYVMKDKLTRLSSAVNRELREAEARRRYREAEEALRRSERQFRNLVEQAVDAIFVMDPEGRIVDANRHACESLGYVREELLAMSARDIETGEPAGRLEWDEVRSGAPLTRDAVYRRKDGTAFQVEVRLGVFEEEGRLVIAVARDLTERKEAERRLGEAETRYRSLVEQIPAITYIQEPIESDNPKVVTYMSPQYETMLGYPPEKEILDEEHWLRTLHPEDRDRVLAEEARTDGRHRRAFRDRVPRRRRRRPGGVGAGSGRAGA